MKREIIKLTSTQLDALKEIASIGVSHSATALSKMLNEKVMIDVPTLNILPIKEFENLLGSPKDLIVGVYFRVLGKASGRILLSFKKESAFALVDVLLKKPIGFTKTLTDYDQSALSETSTILTAGCLNALAEFLGMTFMPSVPYLAFDHSPKIVDMVFKDIPKNIEYTVIVDSEFRSQKSNIKGRFFVFPDEDALLTIWHAIGMAKI